MRTIIVACFGLVGAVLVACGSAPDESTGAVDESLAGGCHAVCPKCPANQICPMIACYEVCNGKPKQCVQTMMCVLGAVWDSKSCQCIPSAPTASSCTTDGDCRTFADYCTGCDCRALSTTDADPTCSGPGVRCLADPCGGKTAVCVSGSCSLQ